MGAGRDRFAGTGPFEMRKAHHNPCRMEGNGSVWRAGGDLC
jgi:hypothetical protein